MKFWLSYCFLNDHFHVESEDQGLATNFRAYLQNRRLSYIPIAVFSSWEEATNAIRELIALKKRIHDKRARGQSYKDAEASEGI